ncbi:hypothetical protein [Acaryochloris sp. 'Moss Beach']|uniref:hypothetical protein n=1 Tax=Acaryochloris sp. 'Moss Beach' TaxID=2740837 RepID=UPI001F1AA1A0|nr:hypothetical protein [Acaryochloris sp. 'Moss Beach']
MRKTVLGVTFILLSMGIASCGLVGGDEPEAEQASETPTEQSFPDASPEIPSPPAAKVVLTRPTNPDERLRVVKSGRVDPFAEIVPAVVPENSSPRTVPSQGRPPSTVNVPKATVPATAPKASSAPSGKPSSPSTKPSTTPGKIVLPTLPKPEVAQGVKVTGVINLGGRPKAILKAPGENSTRTVGVGDRIANGQVLVKSINLSNPAAPVVVLEQSGMKVRVSVGQEPIALASADKDKDKK